VFLLTTLALGATLYLRRPPGLAGHLGRFSLSPPAESSRQVLRGFALSPDGQLIAFVARGAARGPRIYIQRMDGAAAQPLAGTGQGEGPFWSPDSRALGFSREAGLYRTDLGSNPPRRLCDIPGTFIRGGTWNAKGVIVFAAQTQAGGLFRCPDTG